MPQLAKREWIEPRPVHVPDAIQTIVGGHALVAETLVRRGITDVDAARAFLDPARYRPTPATEIPHIIPAAERLERAIRQAETICVWGDFDVDGQTATTILVSTLQDLGARVRFYIPHRRKGGHGVHRPILQQLITEGIHLLLTCDTGITAHDAVVYAQSHGVDVVITDHHDLPDQLPPAQAVVNPKTLPTTHPLRELPGAGVAYKLAELLYERAGRPADVTRHLDLVALAIVADVATQSGDVRYLLQRGLESLRQTSRPGLQAMMEMANIRAERLTEEHIAFELAPRMNALGRLDDATVAVEFLSTTDISRARILALQMDGLNARRKLLCDQVLQAAEAQIAQDPSLLEYNALVLSHPDWPAGIVGIVAGRLAKRYQRPVILITTPPGEVGHGSARSVEGCDIHAAIAAHGDMLEGFGGHPMAAGLAIVPERIPRFREVLSDTIRRMGFSGPRRATIPLDGYVPLSDLSLELVAQLERLAPFGPGNPPLILASRGLVVKRFRTLGRTGEHLRVTVADADGETRSVLWWRGDVAGLPSERFDLAYTVRASDYRGRRDVQIEWVDARPVEVPRTTALLPRLAGVQVVDYRQTQDPYRVLQEIRATEDGLVWAEGEERVTLAGRDRWSLEPALSLVIWTPPPAPSDLEMALRVVSPQTVYLIGVGHPPDHPSEFLERLAGMVKYGLKAYQGRLEIPALASATAQREVTVRVGLAWLAAKGVITLRGEGGDEDEDENDDEVMWVAVGEGKADRKSLAWAEAQLKDLLAETRAYRAYFRRVDAKALIQR